MPSTAPRMMPGPRHIAYCCFPGTPLPRLTPFGTACIDARFARDEVFVTGVHDAVDHNAVVLESILARHDAMEGKMGSAEAVVSQLGLDAKANDDRLGQAPRGAQCGDLPILNSSCPLATSVAIGWPPTGIACDAVACIRVARAPPSF